MMVKSGWCADRSSIQYVVVQFIIFVNLLPEWFLSADNTGRVAATTAVFIYHIRVQLLEEGIVELGQRSYCKEMRIKWI